MYLIEYKKEPNGLPAYLVAKTEAQFFDHLGELDFEDIEHVWEFNELYSERSLFGLKNKLDGYHKWLKAKYAKLKWYFEKTVPKIEASKPSRNGS